MSILSESAGSQAKPVVNTCSESSSAQTINRGSKQRLVEEDEAAAGSVRTGFAAKGRVGHMWGRGVGWWWPRWGRHGCRGALRYGKVCWLAAAPREESKKKREEERRKDGRDRSAVGWMVHRNGMDGTDDEPPPPTNTRPFPRLSASSFHPSFSFPLSPVLYLSHNK